MENKIISLINRYNKGGRLPRKKTVEKKQGGRSKAQKKKRADAREAARKAEKVAADKKLINQPVAGPDHPLYDKKKSATTNTPSSETEKTTETEKATEQEANKSKASAETEKATESQGEGTETQAETQQEAAPAEGEEEPEAEASAEGEGEPEAEASAEGEEEPEAEAEASAEGEGEPEAEASAEGETQEVKSLENQLAKDKENIFKTDIDEIQKIIEQLAECTIDTINDAQNKIRENIQRIDEIDEKTAQNQGRIQINEESISNENKEIKQIEQDIEEKGKQIDKSKEITKSLIETNDEIKQRIDDADKLGDSNKKKALEADLKERQNEVGKKIKELEEQKEDYEKLKQEKQTKKDEMTKVIDENKRINEENEKYKSEVVTLTEQIKKQEEANTTTLKEKEAELEAQREKLKEIEAELNKKNKNEQEENKTKENDFIKKQTELENQLTEATDEKKKHLKQIDSLEKKLIGTISNDKYEEVMKELDTLKQQKTDSEAKISEVEKKRAALEKEKDEFDKINKKKDEEIQRIKKELHTNIETLEKERDSIQILTNQLNVQKQQNADIQIQIDTEKLKTEEITRQLFEARRGSVSQAEIQKLQQQLAGKNAEIERLKERRQSSNASSEILNISGFNLSFPFKNKNSGNHYAKKYVLFNNDEKDPIVAQLCASHLPLNVNRQNFDNLKNLIRSGKNVVLTRINNYYFDYETNKVYKNNDKKSSYQIDWPNGTKTITPENINSKDIGVMQTTRDRNNCLIYEYAEVDRNGFVKNDTKKQIVVIPRVEGEAIASRIVFAGGAGSLGDTPPAGSAAQTPEEQAAQGEAEGAAGEAPAGSAAQTPEEQAAQGEAEGAAGEAPTGSAQGEAAAGAEGAEGAEAAAQGAPTEVINKKTFKDIIQKINLIIDKVKDYKEQLKKEGKNDNLEKLANIKKILDLHKKIKELYKVGFGERAWSGFKSFGNALTDINTSKKIADSVADSTRAGVAAIPKIADNAGKQTARGARATGTALTNLVAVPLAPLAGVLGAPFMGKKKEEPTPQTPESTSLQQAPASTASAAPASSTAPGPEGATQPAQAGGGDKDTKDDDDDDKNTKQLTAENCKKLKEYLHQLSQLLKDFDNITDKDLSDISRRVSNAVNSSGANESKTSLFEKMKGIQNSFNHISSGDTKKNSTEILSKATMIIYDIILMAIVILCVVIYILFIINMIKFLYQCFLEIGNSQHNNLLTGNTLRYKLLGYIVYINNCNIPSLFSSFNSVDTSSSTFMRLSTVLKQYFANKPPEEQGEDTFTSIFTQLEERLEPAKTPKDKAKERYDAWEQEQTEPKSEAEKTQKKEEFENDEISKDQKRKQDQYEQNKSYKEPKFNIFLCIRLLFICIKLFITFITIVVVSIITFILIAVVSQMANMNDVEIRPFLDQKLFSLLVQLLIVSLVHIFVTLIVYKVMFVKLYNKYLKTYLNIIAIDFKINIIKNLDSTEHFDIDLANLLKMNIDNDANIEDKLIDIINETDSTNFKKEKHIIIYILLKHLYSYNKDKTAYLLYYNYFIKTQEGVPVLPSELNMDKNDITTFYSLIPNKHRKTPISYFKFSNIDKITEAGNLENAETIRQSVNTHISQINTFISEANSYFDDDNFIIDLGWYMLINIILGTIYISVVIMITLQETNTGNIPFNEFIQFN